MNASSVHSGRAAVDLRLGQGLDVGVVDLLLAVGQHLEALEHLLQLLVVEMIAQIADALAQGVPAAVLAQHQFRLGEADVLGLHDLVGACAP